MYQRQQKTLKAALNMLMDLKERVKATNGAMRENLK